MSLRTVVIIVVVGALGAFAFIILAMLGFKKLADKPMVRACVDVANKYNVKEVSLAAVPKDEKSRTLVFGYVSDVRHALSDDETAEMEGMAKFAWEQAVQAELLEISNAKVAEFSDPKVAPKRKELEARPTIRLVTIHRTWRRDRGCFKRSEEATHEWIPPPLPGRR